MYRFFLLNTARSGSEAGYMNKLLLISDLLGFPPVHYLRQEYKSVQLCSMWSTAKMKQIWLSLSGKSTQTKILGSN